MAEMKSVKDHELETAVGGYGEGRWVTVSGLQTGYLAMRLRPTYDANNEIRGSESYNGDKLQIVGGTTVGTDGETYVWVYNPRTGKIGWTNLRYLR